MIEAYFMPDVDGEIKPWNDKLGAHRFSRTTIRKLLVERFNVADDGNIFGRSKAAPKRIEEMTDEELLMVLSRNLPDAEYFATIKQKDGYFREVKVTFKRMKKA